MVGGGTPDARPILPRFPHGMQRFERQTRSFLTRLFAARGVHPRHDLGQNFLIDLNLLDLIVAEAEISPGDLILEIGTGTGSLVSLLAECGAHVVSLELDERA